MHLLAMLHLGSVLGPGAEVQGMQGARIWPLHSPAATSQGLSPEWVNSRVNRWVNSPQLQVRAIPLAGVGSPLARFDGLRPLDQQINVKSWLAKPANVAALGKWPLFKRHHHQDAGIGISAGLTGDVESRGGDGVFGHSPALSR